MIQNNKPMNFKGEFQGIMKSIPVHNIPRNPLPSCIYADRLMMDIVSSTISNPKNMSTLSMKLEEKNGQKNIVFTMKKDLVNKKIPMGIKLTKGIFSNLENPKFWRILNNKKVGKIKYQLNDADLRSMQTYFSKPQSIQDKLSPVFIPEDSKIIKKINKFKKALMKMCQNPQEKSWIQDYFSAKPAQL